MNSSTYRDMHLLNELTDSPGVTQRELSKRIGIALGLTNLMLRRLVNKGYVKILGTKRSRIRYLITPKGILEKSRLTYEFIQYSLQLYGRVRHFLREQLAVLAQTGNRRVLLCGTGELAELAFLVIREMGLELVGVVSESADQSHFLGYPVQWIGDVPASAYDRIIVSSLRAWEAVVLGQAALGVPAERMIVLPLPGMRHFSFEGLPAGQVVSPPLSPFLIMAEAPEGLEPAARLDVRPSRDTKDVVSAVTEPKPVLSGVGGGESPDPEGTTTSLGA